jgi:hypothetical protein
MAETEIVIPPRRIIEHLERHNHATRVNHAPIRTWYQGDCFRLDGANEVSVLLVLSAFVAKARVEGCPVLVGALEVDHTFTQVPPTWHHVLSPCRVTDEDTALAQDQIDSIRSLRPAS